jgi:hypothetical protein
MKRPLLVGIAAFSLSVAAVVAYHLSTRAAPVFYPEVGERVALNKLPAALRVTIENQAKTEDSKIGDIKVFKENDKTVYEADIEKDGKTTVFKITVPGKTIKDEATKGKAATSTRNDLQCSDEAVSIFG